MEFVFERTTGGFCVGNVLADVSSRKPKGKRKLAFILQFLSQVLHLLESFVARSLELFASRFGASKGGFQFNAKLEFVLLEVPQLCDNRTEN